MNFDKSPDGEFEDPFVEASYQAWRNAENGEEAFKTLTFSAGVDPEQAVRNICLNAPEEVVRFTLTGLMLGFLDGDRSDLVMEIMKDMGVLALELQQRGEL